MLRQVKRVVKFWKEYAGHKPIHAMSDEDLRDYIDWRRDYYPKLLREGKILPRNAKPNPADKTLQWELTPREGNPQMGAQQGPKGRQTAAYVLLHAQEQAGASCI